MLLRGYSYQLVNIFCLPSSTEFNAVVELEQDVSEAMPYLNAVVRGANYAHAQRVFDFMKDGHIVTLLPTQMKVTGLTDDAHAVAVIGELCDLINAVGERRHDVEPKYEHVRRPSALDVLRDLPRTNCGECGVPTCLAFAAQVVANVKQLEGCPELGRKEWADNRERLVRLVG